MSTCGQCEYYLIKTDECPHPEKRALDKACDKFQYTNPRKRIDYLQAENKRLREILAREVDDGRAEVDDIGIEAWIEQALKEDQNQEEKPKEIELEKAAKKAAHTGNRTDLQEYLKMRRNYR